MIKRTTDEFNYRTIFSVIIVLSPWLSYYGTFIAGITVADVLLIVSALHYFIYISKTKKVKISFKMPFVLIVFLVISSMINATVSYDFNYIPVITRLMKFSFYWFVIVFIYPYYLDKKTFYKTFDIFSMVSCIGLLLQYVVYYSKGIYLNLKIPFMQYANEGVESVDYAFIRANDFRPSSIFIEPAHVTTFLSVYLAVLLFKNDNKLDNRSIIITLFILSTTSSTGIVSIVFLWILYYMRVFLLSSNTKSKFVMLFVLPILFSAIIVFFVSNPLLFQAVERISDPNSMAVTGRINAGDNLVASLSGFQRLIGVGFGNIPHYRYINSINYLIYFSGYVGLGMYLMILIVAYFKSELLGKVLILLFILFSTSRPIVISSSILLYFAIIFINKKHKKLLRTKET